MTTRTTAQPPADRGTHWLRRRLGRAVVLSYAAAVFLPGPGLWLRRTHALPVGAALHLPLSTTPLLLSLVLFAAGLQPAVPVLESVRPDQEERCHGVLALEGVEYGSCVLGRSVVKGQRDTLGDPAVDDGSRCAEPGGPVGQRGGGR
ncbi:hypothetical protein GCM10010521_15770 [Streptomyces rameus]|uniref:Uncharacterized protein n=1 Tax=Streptomyces rameus TaxID=68261 RepID=A0ABP6MYK4_9ACTN